MSPELISKIEAILGIIGAVTVLATAIAHLTPSTKDDGVVKKVADIVFKLLAYMPTIGINPKTKEMEKTINEYKLKEYAEKKEDV